MMITRSVPSIFPIIDGKYKVSDFKMQINKYIQYRSFTVITNKNKDIFR